VIQRLLKTVALVGSDSNGVAVVLKALTNGSQEERTSLALALHMEPGLILSIARSRYGHAVAQLVVSFLPQQEKQELCREVTAHAEELRASRYGRLVLNNLEAQAGPASFDLSLHSDTD